VSPRALPADTKPGRVHLVVPDLTRSIDFYRDYIGLQLVERRDGTAALAARADEPILLRLTEDRTRAPRPDGVVGLYHFAILLPSRRDLGSVLLHLFERQWPFQGFADHGVSEAAYLADPDGNGIELYADTPRENWQWSHGQIQMSTYALNVNALLRLVGDESFNGIASGTRIGHMHLHVSSIYAARQFYHEVIGFDITNSNYPGAVFYSAGGYHHHLGTNTWLRPANAGIRNPAGLADWLLHVPGSDARDAIVSRARAAGVPISDHAEGTALRDPDGTMLIIAA